MSESPRELKNIHDNGDGTWSFWCDTLDGGKEVVTVRLPPLLRRMAINALVAEAASDDKDVYLWQCACAAAVGLGYQPGRKLDLPARMPASAQETGEACADALYAAGFDVFSESYMDGSADFLSILIDSIVVPNREAAAAREQATETFQKAEEETPQ